MDISLKKHSIDEIQTVIAKALSDLCGENVKVDISTLAWDGHKNH